MSHDTTEVAEDINIIMLNRKAHLLTSQLLQLCYVYRVILQIICKHSNLLALKYDTLHKQNGIGLARNVHIGRLL